VAETIKRVGPPKATDLKGEEFTWSIALNQVPSKEWAKLFAESNETTAICHPKRLGMMHQALVFKCEEAHVPTWVQYIDKWIAAANHALTEHEQAEKRRKADEARTEEDRLRRIRQANEKFKSL
jgi:carbonic anhydrase